MGSHRREGSKESIPPREEKGTITFVVVHVSGEREWGVRWAHKASDQPPSQLCGESIHPSITYLTAAWKYDIASSRAAIPSRTSD